MQASRGANSQLHFCPPTHSWPNVDCFLKQNVRYRSIHRCHNMSSADIGHTAQAQSCNNKGTEDWTLTPWHKNNRKTTRRNLFILKCIGRHLRVQQLLSRVKPAQSATLQKADVDSSGSSCQVKVQLTKTSNHSLEWCLDPKKLHGWLFAIA